MSTPTENPNASEAPIFHPFPEPSTMPAGWDLSGLMPDPESAPAASTDDEPEA